jgi:signal transduction histidine kinase/CheY-like chemotaxis protein
VKRALAGEAVTGLPEFGAATFETWTVPLRNERNEIVGATGVIVDISERRRLETDLANAQKMEVIGHLAGGIAHDFNNNLTAILGYVDLLRLGADSAELAEGLDEVRHAAERAAGLVRRLLAFGRRQMLQPRMIGLNDVIESLMPMLQRLIGETIEVSLALGPDLPAIVADPVEIEQILMNLALNARDAMPRGGRLSVDTAFVASPIHMRPGMPPGPHVVLTVRDTGTGMTADVKARVFEPFFTTKSVDKGTGLGLSTVYGLVKQLGGFIDVESDVGQGTVFQVTLPGVEGEKVDKATPLSAEPRKPLSRATVLLVEDEAPVRRFARAALEYHGFAVIDAPTPDAALSMADDGRVFSLLLTDVVMPRLSGPELARRLRERRPDLKVLYMSGYPANLVRQESLDPDMQLLTKPFTAAQLVTRVGEMLAVV